ncbi:acyl-CoA dehydrogenase [Ahniella affigens]|uniref:Acyl-CoA dehydrogenase n=1 Tax=Ahniella affigens TaxID=2021234 RepID=A0A2P1PMI4_9GAMM|nr:acyl-CoA dehydrogenase [Ahniella affigens]AVP96045.1 acyl-CoA dehydrogenase [Ahniella affigens]
MQSPLIDRRLLDFLLYEVLKVESLCESERFAEHSRATFDATIELAHRLAVDKFLPHNRKSDANEPQMVDGKVVLIPEIGEAVAAYNEAGFSTALEDFERGGMQLPFVIASACDLLFAGANPGTVAYPSLARAAANLLRAHGSEAQQRRYMDPIVQGRFFGTMCLSEPQAGSSLGDIRTTAVVMPDGSYRLRGAKMWISAGDHELGDNIVHLVLARIEGAPAGVRGISLFIVPRWRLDASGNPSERNDVRLAGLNHKLGQRGSVNTFLKFGEQDDCFGELIGQPNQGLAYMFHMMNEERIAVGMGAIANGLVGYLYSLQYAKERRQGRHPDQKDASSPPVPIIEHADVRRMLLRQKLLVEGALALGLYASQLVDAEHLAEIDARREINALLELLTPIVKSWSSQYCLDANDLAIQILGGYGYTREYPVEQCWRDNRINPIHEGTNGIQALDLLGRKVMMHDGIALKVLLAKVHTSVAKAEVHASLHDVSAALRAHFERVVGVVRQLGARMASGDIRPALAHAQHVMHVLGHGVIAWMWLDMAHRATHGLESGAATDHGFYEARVAAAKAFFATELPSTEQAFRAIESDECAAYHFQAAWF